MDMKINTLIVDDEPLARDRVKRFLRDENDIKVIGRVRQRQGSDFCLFAKSGLNLYSLTSKCLKRMALRW
jgi:DNA-binding NarL/FixJ family response regulator